MTEVFFGDVMYSLINKETLCSRGKNVF